MINIHPNDQMTVEQLLGIEPEYSDSKTEIWEPIQHGRLVECLIQTSEDMGLEVVDQAWFVKKRGQIFYGSIDYKLGVVVGEGYDLPDISMSMALRHSNCGRYSLAFMPGARVNCSSTGFMVNDIALTRKHTARVVLTDTVEDGLSELIQEANGICDKINAMRRYAIDDREAGHLLVRLAQYRIISYKMIEDVWMNWRKPSYPEFKPRTAWSLYHAVMLMASELAPNRQVYVLRNLYRTMQQVLESGKVV